jgi:hypothetical protein
MSGFELGYREDVSGEDLTRIQNFRFELWLSRRVSVCLPFGACARPGLPSGPPEINSTIIHTLGSEILVQPGEAVYAFLRGERPYYLCRAGNGFVFRLRLCGAWGEQ